MTQVNLRDKPTTSIALAVKDHDGLTSVSDAVRVLMRDGLRWRQERGLGPVIKPKNGRRRTHGKPSKVSAAVPKGEPATS